MNYLKSSICYTLEFLPRLSAQSDLLAEPLLQLIRDIYQYKFQKEAFLPVTGLVQELGLSLSTEQLELLTLIENSQRKQKDYDRVMAGITVEQLQPIIDSFFGLADTLE